MTVPFILSFISFRIPSYFANTPFLISPEDLSESIVFSSSLRSSWAKKIAATYNLLKEKGIDSIEKLDEAIKESKTAVRDMRENIRDIETKIADINDTIKYVERVSQYRPVYNEYLKSGKSPAFYEAHRTEIMLYESAQTTLTQKGLHGESVRLSQLQRERSVLEDQKLDLSVDLETKQKEYNNLLTTKRNVETIIYGEQGLKKAQTLPYLD